MPFLAEILGHWLVTTPDQWVLLIMFQGYPVLSEIRQDCKSDKVASLIQKFRQKHNLEGTPFRKRL